MNIKFERLKTQQEQLAKDFYDKKITKEAYEERNKIISNTWYQLLKKQNYDYDNEEINSIDCENWTEEDNEEVNNTYVKRMRNSSESKQTGFFTEFFTKLKDIITLKTFAQEDYPEGRNPLGLKGNCIGCRQCRLVIPGYATICPFCHSAT